MIGRVLTMILALGGAGAASQAPEFTQQYRQALGGAVQELQVIVEDFDRASTSAGLTRQEALNQYTNTDNDFLAERGNQISGTLGRFERLKNQSDALETAGPFERIWLVIQDPDSRIVQGARERFEPAIPLTIAGGVMALLGAFIGWLLGQGTRTTVKTTGKMLRRTNKQNVAKG